MNKSVVIVGGGVVGGLLALRLQEHYQHITLIEQRSLEAILTLKPGRTLALTPISVYILDQFGLWPTLKSLSCPIREVHVSVMRRLGTSRIKSSDYDIEALGYVIEQAHLEKAIYTQLLDSRVNLIESTKVEDVSRTEKGWSVLCQKQGQVVQHQASWLIASDGPYSNIRDKLQITYTEEDYQQTAWVGTVHLKRHDFIAYERFTEDGAIAFLPMKDNLATFIWTLPTGQAQALSPLSEEAFLASLLETFPKYKANIRSLNTRISFPLKGTHAHQQIAENALLLGNAAHSLHPIAAQGLNLSLRDMQALLKLLKEEPSLGLNDLLKKYEKSRLGDQQSMSLFTDLLARFVASSKVPSVLKGFGLTGFDMLSPMKHYVGLRSMGYR